MGSLKKIFSHFNNISRKNTLFVFHPPEIEQYKAFQTPQEMLKKELLAHFMICLFINLTFI